jgi:hypothetical protein
LINPKKIVLRGNWVNDALENNKGEMTYNNGDKYEGEVKNMKR